MIVINMKQNIILIMGLLLLFRMDVLQAKSENDLIMRNMKSYNVFSILKLHEG